MKSEFWLLLIFLSPAAAQRPLDVLPLPAQFELHDGQFILGPTFTIGLEGAADQRLERGAKRLMSQLALKTGLPLGLPSASAQASLLIHVDAAGGAVQDVDEDEGYLLQVSSSGARLSAATTLGALRGMETFLQLTRIGPEGFAIASVTIRDKPRFAWRGLLVDTGRHFMPVDALKRNIDAMAAVKMNVLHWHLSEYQGFRVESRRFPRLQELGSDGLYYTQAQIRDIVAYARDRGVRVVPEFDMPGHSTAWFVGYPSLASGPGPYSIERRFGIFDPAMDPTRESTYRFLDQFIAEMAGLFPDRYFHIGGDEVDGKQWDDNPRVRNFMREHGLKDDHELQLYFNGRVQRLLAKHGKIMDGWEEILGPGLPKNAVVQAWRGQDALAGAVKQGYRGLLSFGYYLNEMWPASRHYLVEPMEGAAAALSPEEKQRVLGGEACLWTEGVSPDNIDSRLWPRAAAVAERLWSPRQARDVDSLYDRLEAISDRLELAGVKLRSGPDSMLRRMAGGGDVSALKALAQAVVPVDQGSREEAATAAGAEMTTATPLNALTDAVPPESDSARHFTSDVDAFLSGRVGAEAGVRARLTQWRDNDARLEPLLKTSFLLKGLPRLSQALSQIGAAGLQALDYIDGRKPAPRKWEAEQLAMLEKASQPQADVRFAAQEAVERLIKASRVQKFSISKSHAIKDGE